MRAFSIAFVCLAAFSTFHSNAAAIAESTTEKNFSVQAGGQLVLDADSGNIDLRTSDRNEVAVVVKRSAKAGSEKRAKEILAAHEISFDQDGDRAQVTGKFKKEFRLRNGSWFGSGESLEVRYEVTVPARFNVEMRTAAGSIAVADLEGRVKVRTAGGNLKVGLIKGPVDATTSAGSIELAGASETVMAKTSGGNIALGTVEADAQVQTSAGSIRVKSARGKLLAKTSGGNIDIGELDGPSELETSAGSIRVGLAKARLQAKTSGGNISLEDVRESVVAHTSAGSVHAGFTAQPTDDCRLTTSGGSITVKLADKLSFDVDATTSGGNVRTDLPVVSTVVGEHQSSVLKGKLNGGGKLLLLKTSAGSIHIQKY